MFAHRWKNLSDAFSTALHHFALLILRIQSTPLSLVTLLLGTSWPLLRSMESIYARCVSSSKFHRFPVSKGWLALHLSHLSTFLFKLRAVCFQDVSICMGKIKCCQWPSYSPSRIRLYPSTALDVLVSAMKPTQTLGIRSLPERQTLHPRGHELIPASVLPTRKCWFLVRVAITDLSHAPLLSLLTKQFGFLAYDWY